MDTSPIVKELKTHLSETGYWISEHPIGTDTFETLLSSIGEIDRREDVRMHLTQRGVHSPSGIPFHSDQEYVDFIGWHCVQPAVAGGATQLTNLLT